MPPAKNIAGQRFGYFQALERSPHPRGRWKEKLWKCLCVCGTIRYVRLQALTSGRQKSCGCKRAELCQQGLLRAWERRGGGAKGRYCSPEHNLWRWAKLRAQKQNVPFTITIDDIVIPPFCPLLDIPLWNGSKTGPNSPTLDKIIPTKGYVVGNIRVISHKANTMKNSSTFHEMELMVLNWRKLDA